MWEPFDRYVYDRDKLSFRDLDPDNELMNFIAHPAKRCYSCALKVKDDQHNTFQRTNNDVTICGIRYHLYDFVYVPIGASLLYKIAQIIDLHGDGEHPDGIKVQFYSRCDRRFRDVRQDPQLEVRVSSCLGKFVLLTIA